mgnify:CR=1 FL=1
MQVRDMSKMDYPDFEPSWTGTTIEPAHCPSCKVSFKGAPIPKEDQKFYGHKTHFSRVIWISSMKRDMGVAYKCQECGHHWAIPGREELFKEFMEK